MRGILDQAGRAARHLVVALALATLGAAHGQTLPEDSAEALQAMPGARAENPASRVGRLFWVQSAARPFTPDFFEAVDLDRRVPVDRVLRFVVTAVELQAAAEPRLLYRVRFESDLDAFIPVADFEAHLYVDLPPQSETRLKTDLFTSPEAYFYSIKSIFSEEPGQLWERVRTLGPSRILPAPPVVPPRPDSGKKPRKP